MFQFTKVRPEAQAPVGRAGDAGLDVFACLDREIMLGVGDRASIPTGLAFACPQDMVLQVWPRSGYAVQNGLDTLAGVIDSSYRGEVQVLIINHGKHACIIKPGVKIAQLLPVRLHTASLVQVDAVAKLGVTERGAQGFGSTGTGVTGTGIIGTGIESSGIPASTHV